MIPGSVDNTSDSTSKALFLLKNIPLFTPTSTSYSSRDITAQSNSVHFRSPSPLSLCDCNLRDSMQVGINTTHCADTGGSLDLTLSETPCHPEWFWTLSRKKKKQKRETSICSVVRTGLFLACRNLQLWNLCLQIRPLFNNAGCGDQNSNSRVTCHPLSPLSTEGGRREIPGGRTVVLLLILLSQPGTNSPWCQPCSGSWNVHKPEFWMQLSIGEENREGLRILQRVY